jgi:D-arabinose 1-dehydrogenase-like Zn-dependent alcohol dehydrogenase
VSCCPAGVEGLSVGDRVGYITRSHLGGSYADFTVVASPQVTKLPEGVSTQDAAAVLLQGLTALSQATVAISNDIQPGWWGVLQVVEVVAFVGRGRDGGPDIGCGGCAIGIHLIQCV